MAMKPTANVIKAMADAFRSSLSRHLGFSHEGRRDLYTVLGYPQTVQIADLFGMYYRNDIASRIIRAFPQATWRDAPIICDDEGDSDELGKEGYSEFTATTSDLMKRVNAYRFIERADRLSTIGHYGLLVMGFADGKMMDQPLDGKARLVFLAPYAEPNIVVAEWDTDQKSPRFGQPIVYNVQNTRMGTDSATAMKSFRVHWTRTLHISEALDQDEVYGVPRLLPIFNRLKDLEKVLGSSAEVFWLSANRQTIFTVDKEMNLDEETQTKFKDQSEEMAHQLRRHLVGQGITAQVLAGEDHDPGPIIDRLLDVIAGTVGMPKRIMTGSERGELSSSQDENNWNERIVERRENFATPSILNPFIKKMIDTGNLPQPVGTFYVEWPAGEVLSENIKADIAVKKSTALATYANSPGSELIVPVQEFRKDVLGLPPESDYETAYDEEPLPEEEPVIPPVGNAEKKTLYAFRKVLNSKAIIAWAKAQGIPNLEPAEELHVTICYSKAKVDWMKAQEPWGEDENGNIMVHPGGPRMVDVFGKDNDDLAIVLLFKDSSLDWRHAELRRMGASHDFPEYQSHITIGRITRGDEIAREIVQDITPYQGAIALGPEEFREIDQ